MKDCIDNHLISSILYIRLSYGSVTKFQRKHKRRKDSFRLLILEISAHGGLALLSGATAAQHILVEAHRVENQEHNVKNCSIQGRGKSKAGKDRARKWGTLGTPGTRQQHNSTDQLSLTLLHC